jgi:hypothetical protein
MLRRSRRHRRDDLQHLEPLEFKMENDQRAPFARIAMRGAEGFRAGPYLEFEMRSPQRMRSIENVILALRSPEEMEFDEAEYAAEVTAAFEPSCLEGALVGGSDLEAIHDANMEIPQASPERVAAGKRRSPIATPKSGRK